MLETLLFVVLVSLLSIIIGLVLLLFFKKTKPILINEQQLVLTFFLGIVIVSMLASWINLFLPLHIISFSPFFLLAIITLLLKRKHFLWKSDLDLKAIKYEGIVFIITLILFIQLGSLTPYMADTQIYHLQIVRWYQNYKTIPGLANLFPRYGFYSNWFHLISTYSLPSSHGNLLYVNTTISIWFTFFILTKIAAFKASHVTEKKFFTIFYITIFLFLFFGWNLLRGNCRSLGNDFIVTLLVLYILLAITESRILNKSVSVNKNVLIFLTLSVPFFKLTGLFVLPLLLIYFIQTKQGFKTYRYSASIALLFIIPFCIKNYIQSGYLLFPYTSLDLFSPDWKLPLPLAQRFQEFITLSNKYIYEGVPVNAWNQSSFKWLNTWFLKLALYDKVLLILLLFSWPLVFYYTRLTNHFLKRNIGYLLAIVPIIIIWFFTSPDPRFLYGFIVFSTFYTITAILLPYIKKDAVQVVQKMAFIAIFLFSIYKICLFEGSLLNAYIPKKHAYEKIEINNNTFYLTKKSSVSDLSECVDLPIPCIYSSNPYLQMRSADFEKGFRMNKSLDSTFISNYIY